MQSGPQAQLLGPSELWGAGKGRAREQVRANTVALKTFPRLLGATLHVRDGRADASPAVARPVRRAFCGRADISLTFV